MEKKKSWLGIAFDMGKKNNMESGRKSQKPHPQVANKSMFATFEIGTYKKKKERRNKRERDAIPHEMAFAHLLKWG